MSNIFAMKVGDNDDPSAVKVILDGRHYLKQQNINEVYQTALTAKADPTEENLEALENILDPMHREMVLGSSVERDNMGNYYLEDTDIPMPPGLVSTMQDLSEMDAPVESLKKFWQQCLLNPNPQARDDFFQYCRDFGITITDEGYVVLYKTVEKNPYGDIPEDLVSFAGVEYLRVKRSDKDPRDFTVVEGGDEYGLMHNDDLGQTLQDFDVEALILAASFEDIVDGESFEELRESYEALPELARTDEPLPAVWSDLSDVMGLPVARTTHGTLQELYEGISNSLNSPYRPRHKGGDYGNQISLGDWSRMPREECDSDPSEACSEGLHVGSYEYVDRFSRANNEILATIVSPRDIVALPSYDHSKIRTCKYYPYAVMERDTEDGSWEEIDAVHLSEDFVEDEANLQEQLNQLGSKEDLTDLEEKRKTILKGRLHEVR
jgi:hypothetical protein